MGATLAAIAYDGDLLVQDAAEVCVAIIVNAHVSSPEDKVSRVPEQFQGGKGRVMEGKIALSSSQSPRQMCMAGVLTAD